MTAKDLTVERLAQVIWDARQIEDPGGERTGYTEDDHSRRPVFWEEVVDQNLWPGSQADQRREATIVLGLLQ